MLRARTAGHVGGSDRAGFPPYDCTSRRARMVMVSDPIRRLPGTAEPVVPDSITPS